MKTLSAAKDAGQTPEECQRRLGIIPGNEAMQRTLFIAGQRDKPLRVRRKFRPGNGGGRLGAAQFADGKQPAKVLVTRAGGNDDRQNRAILHGQLAPDDRLEPKLARPRMKPWRAVNPIAVMDRKSRQPELRGRLRKLLGIRSPRAGN